METELQSHNRISSYSQARTECLLSERRLAIIYLQLILISVFLAGCQKETGSWKRIEDAGILKIGVDPTFPPFEATDGTDLYGIDIDLAEALASNLGLEAEFKYFGYDGLYDALLTGQVDVLVSALAVFPERTRDFAYSEPYFNAGQVAVFHPGAGVTTLENLNEQIIAVELGAEGHLLARDLQQENPGISINTFDSAEKALMAIESGQADIAITDSIGAQLHNWDSPVSESTLFVSDEPYALVVRSEDKLLLEKINASLARLKESGRLDDILGRWLGN